MSWLGQLYVTSGRMAQRSRPGLHHILGDCACDGQFTREAIAAMRLCLTDTDLAVVRETREGLRPVRYGQAKCPESNTEFADVNGASRSFIMTCASRRIEPSGRLKCPRPVVSRWAHHLNN